jgi:hypothetical protein
MENQYLTESVLSTNIPDFNITIEHLGSTDTYHEGKIVEVIKKLQKDDLLSLIKASIQIAVIGAGNKNYGFIRDEKGEVLQLIDLFKKLNIKSDNKQNSKLKDDDLTPRRLVRLFRFQIRNFVQRNKRPSYLWQKYSDKDIDKMAICFPGAEHLIETEADAHYLLKTYKNLDTILETRFCSRLRRVFIARGILKPTDVEF